MICEISCDWCGILWKIDLDSNLSEKYNSDRPRVWNLNFFLILLMIIWRETKCVECVYLSCVMIVIKGFFFVTEGYQLFISCDDCSFGCKSFETWRWNINLLFKLKMFYGGFYRFFCFIFDGFYTSLEFLMILLWFGWI